MAALALAEVFAWPPFLFHLDYFSSESFVLAAGLVTLAVLWRCLDDGYRTKPWLLLALGVVLGLSMSIKTTFIPLAVAAIAAIVVHLARSTCPLWASFALVGVVPAAAAVSFVAFNLPILGRLPSVVVRALLRQDAVVPATSWPACLAASSLGLVRGGTPFLAVAFAALVLAGWLLVSFFLTDPAHRVRRWAFHSNRFDLVAGAVFVVVAGLGFLYCLAASAIWVRRLSDMGVALRNASPCALVVPWWFLCFGRLLYRPVSFSAPRRRWLLGNVAIATAVVAAALSMLMTVEARASSVDLASTETRRTSEEIGRFAGPNGRTAIWDGSPGNSFGEASFHYWGNYRYASERFSDDVIRAYPHYTWFRLRDLPRIMRGSGAGGPSVAGNKTRHLEPSGFMLIAGFIYEQSGVRALVHRLRGGGEHKLTRSNELWTGEAGGVAVSSLACPVGEFESEAPNISVEAVVELLRRRGQIRLDYKWINGRKWLLISIEGDQRSALRGSQRAE
jgi:hypothetical protein